MPSKHRAVIASECDAPIVWEVWAGGGTILPVAGLVLWTPTVLVGGSALRSNVVSVMVSTTTCGGQVFPQSAFNHPPLFWWISHYSISDLWDVVAVTGPSSKDVNEGQGCSSNETLLPSPTDESNSAIIIFLSSQPGYSYNTFKIIEILAVTFIKE